jgi:hypothetical protein
MTSEEIIQRLIEEKKLTVSEAMVIMRDLAKEHIRRMFDHNYIDTDLLNRSFNYYNNIGTVPNRYSTLVNETDTTSK